MTQHFVFINLLEAQISGQLLKEILVTSLDNLIS